MRYFLNSKNVQIEVESLGAELISLKVDGKDYLYDGNPKYWKSHAPTMFPICGRLFDNAYTFNGVRYEMNRHGFAKISEFMLTEQTENSLTFSLPYSNETLKIYPFKFMLSITYSVIDNGLNVKYTVNNLDDKKMYFSIGGHPGFKVPFDKGDFTDYYIEFSAPSNAKRVDYSSNFLMTGNDPLFRGENFQKLNLTHDLFDNDAIFLYDTPKTVSIKSNLTKKSLVVDFSDFTYVGLWHAVQTDAPYVCIEPWNGSPSYDGKLDDITTKRDMIPLDKEQTYTASYSITIK
jgi:galactose mutarotase-like enzyme